MCTHHWDLNQEFSFDKRCNGQELGRMEDKNREVGQSVRV